MTKTTTVSRTGLVANASRLDAEGRRKKEGIDGLVQELIHASQDGHIPSVLRTALERGWREDLHQALEGFETKMTAEISRVCNRHYAEFIDSVEELMKMRHELTQLKDQVTGLNQDVQMTGRSALSTTKTMLRQRYTAQNISSAMTVIAQCDEIVNMVMDAFVHIHDEKYYSALNTMDEINTRLSGLGSIKFASQLRQWMPSLTETINKATKEEMSEWLVQIREVSYKVGGAAMRRYARLASDGSYNPAKSKHRKGQEEVIRSQCERVLVRIEEELGCSFRLEDSELADWVPDFMRGGEDEMALVIREQEYMLDHLSDHLHPVHRALHIFARLEMLPDFSNWYRDNRTPMSELQSMITRELDKLDTEGFLRYLPTLANGIAGFFIVERTLMMKVDHKEGMLSPAQLDEAWEHCAVSLEAQIVANVPGLSRVGHYVQIKETLLTLGIIMDDLEMDTTVLMDLLRRLAIPFQKLQLAAFERTCIGAAEDEGYQPLEVPDREFYDAVILPLGLHEEGVVGVGGVGAEGVDAVDPYYFKAMRFPKVYPFSPTVPEMGFALLKVACMMVAFVSRMEIPNTAAIGFKALEQGASVLQRLVTEQVAQAERDTHILKSSQISVNSAYLARLPISLANSLWECLSAMQLTDLGGGFSSLSEASFQSLDKSGKALELISDRARDLIFELIRRKADELLQGLPFVRWEPGSVASHPQAYADDLVNYLRVTFMNLAGMPSAMREAAHFTCLSHVSNSILNFVLSKEVPTVNMMGIHNLAQDVSALMDFAEESGIEGLRECFGNLWQLVTIVLEADTKAMTDPSLRADRYPRLDVHNLVLLLEKYRNLGWGAKIKSTGDEVASLDVKQVQVVLKTLKLEER